MPASARSSDDLPEPTGPTTSTSCPRSTVRSTSRTPTVPSSCTALNAGQVQPAQRVAGRGTGRRRGAGGEVHPGHRRPSRPPTPVMATVRRVHTRAEGSCETSDAVVQANQRAAPSVDTATRVAPADSPPDRYSAQAADRQQAADDGRGGAGPAPASRSPGAAGRCGRGPAGPGGPAPAGWRRPASPYGPPTATRPARWRTRPGPRPYAGAERSSTRPEQRRGQPGDHHGAGEEQRRHRRCPTPASCAISTTTRR